MARKAEIGGMSLRSLLGVVGLTAPLVATLFLSSGRPDWATAWGYVGIRVGIAVASMLFIASRAPGLFQERFQPGEEVKAWDRPLASMTALLWPVTLIVVGLDLRSGWSLELAVVLCLLAWVVLLLGDVFSRWAAVSNPSSSRLVRIRRDHGHAVVTDGPYRYLRHPGYAGALVAGPATPIVLCSLWVLVVGGVLAPLLIPRTVLEE